MSKRKLPTPVGPDPYVSIRVDGQMKTVGRKAYITAKTKQLVEFGYGGLTEETVTAQLDAVLAGKKLGEGLTVIGAFMQDEVIA